MFTDQRLASNGLSQADPNASPTPALLKTNFGVSVFEQMPLSFAGKESQRGIGIFARISGSPDDRNLISFMQTVELSLRERSIRGLTISLD